MSQPASSLTISLLRVWSRILLHMELATRRFALTLGMVESARALSLSTWQSRSSVTTSSTLNTCSTSRSFRFSSNSLTKCLISPWTNGRWLNRRPWISVKSEEKLLRKKSHYHVLERKGKGGLLIIT